MKFKQLFKKKPTLPPRLPQYEVIDDEMYVERFYDIRKEDWWYYVANTYRKKELIKSEAFGFKNELLLELSTDLGMKFYSTLSEGTVYHYPNNFDCNSKAELLSITNNDTSLNVKIEVIGPDQYIVDGTNKAGKAMSEFDCLRMVVAFRENKFWGEQIFGYWKNLYQFPLNADRPRRFISYSQKPIEYVYIEINACRYRAKFGTTEFISMEQWD